MYQDAFKKLKMEDVATLLDIYNPLFDGSQFDPLETTIMAQDIPFYPGLRYLDIADYSSSPPLRRYAIDGWKKPVVLDWTNEPIYKLNHDVPIVLNEDTVTDYIRFFFDHVRGKHGRFLVVESIENIRWRDDPPPVARKTIGQMIFPVTLQDIKSDKNIHLKMCVIFKDSLFECNAEVKYDGTITIKNEKLLIEDMPILDDAFGQ